MELDELIEEILFIRSQMAEMEEEEKNLRQQVSELMKQRDMAQAQVETTHGKVKVRRNQQVKITYDDELLRQRLGNERFRALSTVDRNKLKQHWEQLPAWLGEHFFDIATLDRHKVKEAVEGGRIEGGIFAGAFKKETQEIVSISVLSGSLKTDDPSEEEE
ncbi:MAG: hypothetical protein ACM3ZQ_05395 [Bacillota bacterium]